MTEVEWMAAGDPELMLAHVGNRVEARLLRRFACACCQRVSHLIRDERTRRALLTAQAYCEGQATDIELKEAANQAMDAADAEGDNGQEAVAVAAASAVDLNAVAASYSAAWAKADAAGDAADIDQAEYEAFTRSEFESEQREQAALLRSLINPFCLSDSHRDTETE